MKEKRKKRGKRKMGKENIRKIYAEREAGRESLTIQIRDRSIRVNSREDRDKFFPQCKEGAEFLIDLFFLLIRSAAVAAAAAAAAARSIDDSSSA